MLLEWEANKLDTHLVSFSQFETKAAIDWSTVKAWNDTVHKVPAYSTVEIRNVYCSAGWLFDNTLYKPSHNVRSWLTMASTSAEIAGFYGSEG